MGKRIGAWWRAHRPTKRRLIQVYAALLYNAHAKGFVKGDIYTGALKNFCVPGLNCYSCPGAIGACPLGALQNALAASGARAPWYALGIVMLFGVTLGRTVCGWLCPMGLLQELIYKIPTAKAKKSRATRALSYVKDAILAAFVVAMPLAYAAAGLPLPAFCKYICPAGTLEGAIGLLAHPANADKFAMLGGLFTRKFVILAGVLAACVFVYRAFCRFLCPLGAVYGLFARLSLLGVKVEADKCTNCGRCAAHCKMDVRRVGDRECIHCAECAEVCPVNAIHLQCGKRPIEKKTASCVRRIAAWTLALAVLCGAVWYVNRGDGASLPTQQDAAVGSEVGMRCPDFSVPLYGADGARFTLSEALGRPVVINFWATWCTPCVNELPHFEAIAEKYGERIAMAVIHSELVTDDVEAFLAQRALKLPFALDETGEAIALLGGSTMLPMTVIVDADGTIVYNQVGSVTYELLESLIEPLL